MQPAVESGSREASPRTRVDPITASIVHGALDNIAIEMGHKLMRMSYSSIIRESEDFGAALCDAEGRQLCECSISTPLQSGPIPGYVRGILRQLKARGDTVKPGDVFIHNDPYGGASHAPDIGFCLPIFHDDKLVAFSVTTAHHLDIGSCQPGSVGVVKCADNYAEGMQLRALRIFDQGQRNDALWQMIADNVRVPDLVMGDMAAQISACRTGASRLLELIDRFGAETLFDAVEDLFDYSERLMRKQIAALPDGSYTAIGHVDGYLDAEDPKLRNLPIQVTVTIAGSDLTVDFTGTSPQLNGHAINMPFEGTVDVAVWLTLRSILLDSDLFGIIPQNDGLYRSVKITAPKGCLANPQAPAPTIARFVSGNIVADTVMRAMAKIVPESVSAGIANLKALAFSGLVDNQHWVHIEIFEGCYGGRYGKDGLDSVDTLYANTRNNPIEDIEAHAPLRVLRYELRDGHAAAGKWRGGVNSVKEIQFLADGAVSVEGDGHAHKPWGLAGGDEGATGGLLLQRSTGADVELPSMLEETPASCGDRLIVFGGTGGGYGDPLERDLTRIEADLADDYINAETATDSYGVAFVGTRIDAAATEALRAERRAAR
jgi:N-methylhydantoinase B